MSSKNFLGFIETFARFSLPIICDVLNISFVDLFKNRRNLLHFEIQSTSLLFIILISLFLCSRKNLLPRAYSPSNPLKTKMLNVIVQIIYCELIFRLIAIPFLYHLHFACRKGYMTKFINKYLFVIHLFDRFLHTRKNSRWLKTEDGFVWFSKAIPSFILIFIILKQGIFGRFRKFVSLIFSVITLALTSFLKIFAFSSAIGYFKENYGLWVRGSPEANKSMCRVRSKRSIRKDTSCKRSNVEIFERKRSCQRSSLRSLTPRAKCPHSPGRRRSV